MNCKKGENYIPWMLYLWEMAQKGHSARLEAYEIQLNDSGETQTLAQRKL